MSIANVLPSLLLKEYFETRSAVGVIMNKNIVLAHFLTDIVQIQLPGFLVPCCSLMLYLYCLRGQKPRNRLFSPEVVCPQCNEGHRNIVEVLCR